MKQDHEKIKVTEVIKFMPEIDPNILGGNMRIGAKTTHINDPSSLACKVHYGSNFVKERHRH